MAPEERRAQGGQGTVVLRTGKLVDGTGSESRPADVVIDNGRITALLDPGEGAGRIIDLDGLVLAPGFIDIHTHYDAQVFWDADLTPSAWHGVTTAVIGNCGFGVAPARPDNRRLLADTLANVEGMSTDLLMQAIHWDYETFPEYLASVDAMRPRTNIAAFVGHSALRLYVMGEDAYERPATEAETEKMCVLLGEALDAGALGFSTSRSKGHVGAEGRPVPSRLAKLAEIHALAEVQRRTGGRDHPVCVRG